VQYVIDAPGLDPLANYPYTAVDGSCAFNAAQVVAKISSWTYTTTDANEHQMANYLAQHGPISVCVDASDWPSYNSNPFPSLSLPVLELAHMSSTYSLVLVCILRGGGGGGGANVQTECTWLMHAQRALTTACWRWATT
jgi:hypothetical protein